MRRERGDNLSTYMFLKYIMRESQVAYYSISDEEIMMILHSRYLHLNLGNVLQNFVVVCGEYRANWPALLQEKLCSSQHE